jgi:hypothetical protein
LDVEVLDDTRDNLGLCSFTGADSENERGHLVQMVDAVLIAIEGDGLALDDFHA